MAHSRLLNPNDLFSQIGFIMDESQKSSPSPSHNKKYHSKNKSYFTDMLSVRNDENLHEHPSKFEQFDSDCEYTTFLEIQLSQNQTHVLKIRSYDNPQQLAEGFCKKHNLNRLAVQIVQKKIIEAKQKEQKKITNTSRKRSLEEKQPFRIKSKKGQKVQNNFCNQNHLKNDPYKRSQKSKSPVKKQNTNKSSLSIQQRPTARNINKKYIRQKNLNERLLEERKNATNLHKPTNRRNKQSVQKACQNLYLRGLIKAKIQEEKRIIHQQEKQAKELEDVTFKPKINDVSQKIIEFRRETGTIKPTTCHKQLTNKFYQQLKECTFTPQINQVSKLIVNNRQYYRNETQHFNMLFNDTTEKQTHVRENLLAETRTLNSKKSKSYLLLQKKIQEQNLYKPKLNPKSIEKVKDTFFVRLQKAIEKKEKIKRKQLLVDENTTFHPKVGRKPYNDNGRNKQNIPVWQVLYRQSQKRNKNLQNTCKSQKTLQQRSFQSLNHQCSRNTLLTETKSISNQYYENLMNKRITQVFQLLDSDGDGLISPQRTNIQQLSRNLLLFLKPIFEEMDELDVELNFNQFRKAVINLLNDSDPHKKGLFLGQNCKPKVQEQSFIPQINPKSRQLTEYRTSLNHNIHQQLYDQGIREKQKKQLFLMRQRAKKDDEELKDCSFKPCLKLGSKNYQPHILQQKISQLQRQPYETFLQESYSFLGSKQKNQFNQSY